MNNLNVTKFEAHHIKDALRLIVGSFLHSPIFISLHFVIGWALFTAIQIEMSPALKVLVALASLTYIIYLYNFLDILICAIMFAYTTKKSIPQIIQLFNGNNMLQRQVKVFLIIWALFVIVLAVIISLAAFGVINSSNSTTETNPFLKLAGNTTIMIISLVMCFLSYMQKLQDVVGYPLSHMNQDSVTTYIAQGISLNLGLHVKMFLTLILVSICVAHIGGSMSSFLVEFIIIGTITNYVNYIIYFNNSFPVKKLLDIKIRQLSPST